MPERKLSFSPISASDSNFNSRNTQCMSVVKIFVFLDLNEKSWFSFGHYIIKKLNPDKYKYIIIKSRTVLSKILYIYTDQS